MPLTTANLDGIVINEVMIDGNADDGTFFDTNGDGISSPTRDDFIELHNTSGSDVDISGWQIWDGSQVRHQFEPGTTIQAGGFLTVIDQPPDPAPPVDGPVLATGDFVFASTGGLSMSSSADTVQLYDPVGDTFIRLSINNHTGATDPSGGSGTQVGPTENASDIDAQSVQRVPDGDTNFATSPPNPGETNCFAAGTEIATPMGDRTVETLRIGDRVITQGGRPVPVLWIGRQVLSKWRHGTRMQPVRIRAGALGDGLPHSDLTVTADHGMVLDDLVINAAALVNGSTIDFVPMDELEDSFTVYHIETEAHDVILANGAPAETFVDYAGRQAFDNHQDYLDLYGAERLIPEMDRPRISARRLVPQAIRARLGIVEEDHGFDQPMRA